MFSGLLRYLHSPPWQRSLHVAPTRNPTLSGSCAWPRVPGCARSHLCCPCGWPGSLSTPRCHTVAWWHRSPLRPPVHGQCLFSSQTKKLSSIKSINHQKSLWGSGLYQPALVYVYMCVYVCVHEWVYEVSYLAIYPHAAESFWQSAC